MKSINWGIIGCGNVTEVKSGPAFNLIEGSKLVAVMRRDIAKAKEYAQRHNVPKWYGDVEELLSDKEINAVYIATPPSLHKEYTLRALAKGFDVYLEKPVALNAVETKEIARFVKNSFAKLSVAHYRRALPMFRFVKSVLNEKTIGIVRMVSMNLWQSQSPSLVASSEKNWRIDPAISGGGLFHDLSPHLLDLMLDYFGNPIRSQGISLNQSRTSSADDFVGGQIVFSNNIVFNGVWDFCVAESESKDECKIVGSEGSISFSLFGNDVIVKRNSGEERHHFEHPNHVQQPMIGSVVRYFQNNGENPCSIDEALSVMEIMDSFTSK